MAVNITCAVNDCTIPRRKRQWCARHYATWRRTGDAETPPAWTHAPKGSPCCVCGSPDLMPGSRRYCSKRCARLMARAKRAGLSSVPQTTTCRVCGDSIDLMQVGRGGRKRSADVQMCDDCRRQRSTHKVSAKVLARRDGTGCAICGDDIDMGLRYPDPMGVTIDRIVPRCAGGDSEPDNLQLAHRVCNQRKTSGFVEVDRSFYRDARWFRMSARVRTEEPECRTCGRREALVANRIIPIHLGVDPWDRANFQTLCRSCGRRKASIEYVQQEYA